MKSEQQIEHARKVVRERLKTRGLNDVQTALLVGMLNSLIWALDGPEAAASTIERLLTDEPLAAGKDPGPALREFRSHFP